MTRFESILMSATLIACTRTPAPTPLPPQEPPPPPDSAAKREYMDAHCHKEGSVSPNYHTADKQTGQTMEVFGGPITSLVCPDDAPYEDLRGSHTLPRP